jgi:hypothetical protein
MPRDGKSQRQIREQIAQLAARLMAEDGMEDFGAAKRKAARQCGAADQRNLPTNEEVEAALRSYRSLYQAEEQRERLKAQRQLALDMMQVLTKFDPHLSGSVLSGNAGRYAEIDIDLFTDSPKAVEYFLVDSGLDFKGRERRVFVGEMARSVPNFQIETENVVYSITVFQSQDLRASVRSTREGRPIDRIRPDRLQEKMALDDVDR